jgi:signal transduction histidine kinase
MLNDIVELYASPVAVSQPQITLLPPDPNDAAWTAELAGERDLFERVLRTLMDNAVKYGRADVRIEAGLDQATWSLRISNPGEMTPQEDRLKFTPFEKPKPSRHDGSHVGLAASLALTRANGGNLTLQNDLTGDAPRVVATLYWPLFQGHE